MIALNSVILVFSVFPDCQMQRIDICPTIYTSTLNEDLLFDEALDEAKQRERGPMARNAYEPPKALFDVIGRVVICEKFSITSSGSIETLYDPSSAQQQQQNVESSLTGGLKIEPGQSEQHSLTSHDSSVKRNVLMPGTQPSVVGTARHGTRKRSSQRRSSLDTPDPSQYVGQTNVSLSQLQLDSIIPGKSQHEI